jgi:TolB-like protein
VDAIVLKALAKSPAARYEGATPFADDLQRSLSGEPVEARPPRLTYHFAKFVLRHRTGFAAAATASVALALAYGLAQRGALPFASTTAVSPDYSATVASPEGTSIAVLPFSDMSKRQDEEYFSDGLSEELIDHLVHGANLKVIARTSSFQFKGRSEDVRSIARTLGVTHILQGSVRRDGKQLRIAAQLIRASDGVNLWSQTYDRNLSDIFKVQDEIAVRVTRALRATLRTPQGTAATAPDIRAYYLVLEGNYFKARMTPGDVTRAVQLYQQAIGISAGYALAWARLASAYMIQEILSGPPTQIQNRRVVAAIERAIALDPTLAWAYYTRAGFEMNVTWNWQAAKADTERLHAIDPRFQLLPGALGDIALVLGEPVKAVESYREELARDPLDPNALNSLGIALCAANLLQQCLQARLSLLQMHPEFGGVNSTIGIAHLYLDQFAAALQALQREQNDDYRLAGLALVYWGMKRRPESDAALNSLTTRFAASDAYGIAVVHAYRGETDEAFRWLDRAYRGRDPGILALKTDPLLRNLHSDPRFHALVNRMRLAGYTNRRSQVSDVLT